MVQLSLKSTLDPGEHLAIGRLLAPLRARGVLILGSGSVTHSFAEIGRPGGRPPLRWVVEFEAWLTDTLGMHDDAARTAALRNVLTAAPHARRAHPTTEHLLPLIAVAGAAVNPDGTAAVGRKAFEGCLLETGSLASFVFE